MFLNLDLSCLYETTWETCDKQKEPVFPEPTPAPELKDGCVNICRILGLYGEKQSMMLSVKDSTFLKDWYHSAP